MWLVASQTAPPEYPFDEPEPVTSPRACELGGRSGENWVPAVRFRSRGPYSPRVETLTSGTKEFAMCTSSTCFTPRLETLETRANPGGRGGLGGEVYTGGTAVVGEVHTAEPAPVGGVWVGNGNDGGRGGISGDV